MLTVYIKMRDKKRGKKLLIEVLKFLVIPLLLLRLINWKVSLIVFLFFLIIKIIQVRKRKYFAKDTEGKEVKFKSFFKKWKDGIEGITPLQQAKTNLMGNWITLTGIVAGIVINALVRMKNQWVWIEVILFGSLVLVVVQMIGGLQKYWRFKEVEKVMKKLEKNTGEKEDLK